MTRCHPILLLLVFMSACTSDDDAVDLEGVEIFDAEVMRLYPAQEFSMHEALHMNDGSIFLAGSGSSEPNQIHFPGFITQLSSDLEISDVQPIDTNNQIIRSQINLTPSMDGHIAYTCLIEEFFTSPSQKVGFGKLNQTGAPIWQKTFTNDDYGMRGLFVVEMNDGDYIIVAQPMVEYGDPNSGIIILRTSSEGDLIWQRLIPDTSLGAIKGLTYDPIARSIFVLANNLLLNQIQLLKFDLSGTLQRSVIIYDNASFFSSGQLTSLDDGSLLVYFSGESIGTTDYPLHMVSLDVDLDTQWTWTNDRVPDNFFEDVVNLDDGSFLLLHNSSNAGNGDIDVFLTKLNANREIMWIKIYGSHASDLGSKLIVRDNNDIVILGNSNLGGSSDRDFNMFSIHTDENGIPQ